MSLANKCHPKHPQSYSIHGEPPASSRQFSAVEVGLLNDKSKAYEVTQMGLALCVMKYCFM